jgi:hypothetical protein
MLGDPRDDSFPFSTYPMFSGRKSTEASIPHVVGYTGDGSRVVLPPEAVANDEVIQAFETVRQAIGQGDAGVTALCEEAARWASTRRENVVSVAVVTDTYDALEYFDGEKRPVASTTHGECEVDR